MGLGISFPELLPIEAIFTWWKIFALRVFYAPPIPFNIRVNMPGEVVSSYKKILGVAYPPTTVKLKAVYGPHYGVDAMIFPLRGSFFILGGMAFRQISLSGRAKGPILVCTKEAAEKEPPCSGDEGVIKTRTQLVLEANTKSTAYLMRGAVGWLWTLGKSGYLMWTLLGTAVPTNVKRDLDIDASISTITDDVEDDISDALRQIKEEKEEEMKQNALKEMRPVEEKPLLMIGLTGGFQF